MRAALISAAVCAYSSAAAAQTCHSIVPADHVATRGFASLRSEVATYVTDRFQGEYQALVPELGWQHRAVTLRVAVPMYRLVRNGVATAGVGDALMDVRVPVVRTSDGRVAGGLGLATTLATGAAARDLGMGHIMLMPGPWVTYTRPRGVFASIHTSFATALGSSASMPGMVMSGPAPLVNPMNRREVEVTAIAAFHVHNALRVRGGVYGAVPIAVDEGRSRAVVLAALDVVTSRRVDAGVEVHVPLVGAPFSLKLALRAALRF